MIEVPDLAVGALALGTLSAFALGGGLLRSRRQLAAQRAKTAALRAQLDGTTRAFTSEVEHLAARRLPAAARQTAHSHVTVPGPLNPQLAGSPLGFALEQVLKGLHAELAAQRTRIDAAAQAGMRGATREIQAALYRLQDALRGLQQRYDDPELAQTLFELDHENEQSLRRAQIAAVVCGAWVGLAREESHLVDAVTGGQARLAGYRRVRVSNHLDAGTALVSHAVEPVAIIVAELLDNALRHSAPDTDVVVNLEAVHHGVCVTVDDAGLGMTQDERARAQRMVAGSDPILLTELGDPPRMGLAAIGQLTRQFDLSVDVSSPSPYGGVRAVLRVDSHLLTRIDPEELPPAASAPRSTRKAAVRGSGSGSGTPKGSGAGLPGTPPAPGPVPATAPHEPESPPATTSGGSEPTAEPGKPEPLPAPTNHEHDHGYGSEQAADDDTPAPGHHGPRGSGGLPQRRRRGRATSSGGPAAAEPAAPHRPAAEAAPQRRHRRPEESAAALGALQAGTAAARTAAGPNTTAVPAVSDGAPAATTADGASEDTDTNDHEGGTAR
ncbi:signal transduction histidine kinase [Streptomyces luteogriseus]|uniref:ATP-binding protein n=1 Tax=Streptomyces luteogriseus TaxID=68233 RepID=UPI002789D826|nr:ATP-binding protein [Streptomyces luteogriseus]MDQ0710978.1 signal transduction histidine kinase [Streptomyces luteogriseus]